MKFSPAGAALLAASLAGCGVGPRFTPPKADLPAAFTPPAAAHKADLPLPSLEWWRGFGAPELDGLMAKALANSPDLAAAAARVVQADQAARVAGSPLLPGLTASGNQSWTRNGRGGSSYQSLLSRGQGSHYTETRSYGAQLNASYELDFWGKNRDALENARQTALASRYDRETVWLTTASSIASNYFEAVGLRDRLVIAQRNVRDAEHTLAAYRARMEAGTANALDVSQQEALTAGYRAQIPALENQYRQQIIALAILVGETPEALLARFAHSRTTLASLKLPEIGAGMPADVLRRRPDLAEAEAQLAAQNAAIRADIADFLPSIQLTASGGVSSAALAAITGPGTLLASLTSQLTQTLFDNGAKSGTLGEARARYQELAADYTKTLLQALSDVEAALAATTLDAEQERLQRAAVQTAQTSADIARAQLAAGTVDIVSVLNTETTLFNDQDSLSQIRISRFTALVSLYKALGGGWSLPNSSVQGQHK